MQDNSKPKRWPETDIIGQAWGIKKFIKSCPVCQQVKINKHEHVKPRSFLTEKTRCYFLTEDLNSHLHTGASNVKCLGFAVKPHQPTILKPMAWWSAGMGLSKMPFPMTAKATRIGPIGCQ